MLRDEAEAEEEIIILNLYDVDGSAYHSQEWGSKGVDVEQWLIDTNPNLLRDNKEEIKRVKPKKVIVALGTNRQCYETDALSHDRGGSCMPLLPILQSYLASQVETEVVLEPFMMADIYGSNLAAGQSYAAALRKLYGDSKNEEHARWVFDHTKVSLIYAHAHRVAALHPHANIIINFFDDKILEEIHDFYRQCPDLLPNNVTLRIHKYKGAEVKKYKENIKGQGSIDTHWHWSVRLMSVMTYYFSWSTTAGKDREINSVEALHQYHEGYRYNHDNREMAMGVSIDKGNSCNQGFDDKRFKRLRADIPERLSANDQLTKIPCYTTAQALCKEGLIPKKFVLNAQQNDDVAAAAVASSSVDEKHAVELQPMRPSGSSQKGLFAENKKLAEAAQRREEEDERVLSEQSGKLFGIVSRWIGSYSRGSNG